jgi:hypothetical protein
MEESGLDDIYNKGDLMVWDKSEYNFFMNLDDMTKVYYFHDYLFGELENISDEFDFEDEWDDSVDSSEDSKTYVDVILDDTTFIIKCDDPIVREKTVNMFFMDGLMLSFLDKKGDDVLIYEIIGEGYPISLN